MRGVEILDRFQLELRRLDRAPQSDEFVNRPKFFRIAREAPAPIGAEWLVVCGGRRAAAKIIHEMCDHVRRTRLPREGEIFRRQHVPV